MGELKTTCNVGTYRVYYYLQFTSTVKLEETGAHTLSVALPHVDRSAEIKIAFSSVNTQYAKSQLFEGSFEQQKLKSNEGWNTLLSRIKVEGS